MLFRCPCLGMIILVRRMGGRLAAGGWGKLEQLLINTRVLSFSPFSFIFLSLVVEEEEEEDEEMMETKPASESDQQNEDETNETKEGKKTAWKYKKWK